MLSILLALALATPAGAPDLVVFVKHGSPSHCTFALWTRDAGSQVVAELPFPCERPEAFIRDAHGDQVLVFDGERLQRFTAGPGGRLGAPAPAPRFDLQSRTAIAVGVGPSSRPRVVLCAAPEAGPHRLELLELDGGRWRGVSKVESYGSEGEGCADTLPKGWVVRGDVSLSAADWVTELPDQARVVAAKGTPAALVVGPLGELSLRTRPALKAVVDACGTPCTSLECARCGLSYRTLGGGATLLACGFCMECDPGGCQFLKLALVPGSAAPVTVDGARFAVRGDLLLTDRLAMTTGGKVLARWPEYAYVRFYDSP